MNRKIKFRESFRPFAPSVLAERVGDYFELDRPSPYMLIVADVRAERRLPDEPAADGEDGAWACRERLHRARSDIPAVTHVDCSARVQTVHRETNQPYWRILRELERRTGYGLVVNTSFNVRGEPIVCTPTDAYRCFMRTEMDALVLGPFLLHKRAQPAWHEEREWRDGLPTRLNASAIGSPAPCAASATSAASSASSSPSPASTRPTGSSPWPWLLALVILLVVTSQGAAPFLYTLF